MVQFPSALIITRSGPEETGMVPVYTPISLMSSPSFVFITTKLLSPSWEGEEEFEDDALGDAEVIPAFLSARRVPSAAPGRRYGIFSEMSVADGLSVSGASARTVAAELDSATRQALTVARQSGELAAALVEREIADLTPEAKLELIAELAGAIEGPAGILRELARGDGDARVRRAAEAALGSLGR